MPQIKASKNVFVAIVLAVIGISLTAAGLYFNRASKLELLQVQFNERQKKLDNSQVMANRLWAIEQNYLEAKAKLSILEQGVSKRAYVPTLLRQLEECGKGVNLRVVGIKPRPPEVKPVASTPVDDEKKKETKAKPEAVRPYDKLDIDVEVNGKYWDVARFLSELTSFPKIIAVNDLQMIPVTGCEPPKRGASPTLSVKFSATAFILKESGWDAANAEAKDQNKDRANGGSSRI